MSDNLRDLARQYEDNVYEEQPRSIGLFPIPEYPELEAGQGMWSAAVQVILTTLRYLAPATLLTLFWGQQSFLFKLLKSVDSAFRAIVFSSEEQKQEVLQWLAEAGPVRIEHLETVWRHGWILCGVLDSALPGACGGHPPTRLSLKHAQTIAESYLGVEPVFTQQELESNDALSRHQEWKLATYLDRIRQALAKLTPPVSKPQSQRTSPEYNQFTLDFVAKGSGLTAAQVNNKASFKIYPTSQQSLDPGEITILIRGPKDTYGMKVIPPVLGKAQMIRQKVLGLQSKPNLTESALPITQGTTYLRNYGKNNMNKTYFIPKPQYDIDIYTETSDDHAKISYTVNLEGKYEISITSRGQNIMGSPFTVTATHNIIDVFEKDNDWLEDGEEIDIVDVKTDRKIVLRIVDFVTEKMLLKENGVLEKISDEKANTLMSTDGLNAILERNPRINESTINKKNSTKFKKTVSKIVQMNRVCKIIRSLVAQKPIKAKKKYSLEQLIEKDAAFSRPQQDIPDIVNSTFSETNINPYVTEKRNKFIVPENLTVALITEKSPLVPLDTDNVKILSADNETSERLLSDFMQNKIEDTSMDRMQTSSNPFLNDICEENYSIEKDLGSFVKTEYETNNSQNEETEDFPIKILVDEQESESPSPINRNPFYDPDIILERPKTPVLKIITGEVNNRDDSVYVDPETERIVQKLANEFINPFYLHHHETDKLPITDFIIGAPVSLPPFITSPAPNPNMESLLITNQENIENRVKDTEQVHDSINEESESIFSTPLHNIKDKVIDANNSSISSTFHSLDTVSTHTNSIEIINLPNIADYQESYDIDKRSSRDITPKKDIWDSAYVSIDDNNSSPDSNNNDNQLSEISNKQKISLSHNKPELSNMGPAERELWQSCAELQINPTNSYGELNSSKWDVKRPIFTPILEESDRSMSTGLKEPYRSDIIQELDTVTVAFAELQDVYGDLSGSDCSSKAAEKDLAKRYETGVDSASETSDVKRHAKELEGKISEVQANVTESVSVSQALHKFETERTKLEDTQFGDSKKTNIVLEKKQYWDKRIREIEAKSAEENKSQQKRKRLLSKQFRKNDSLTRRRGNQIVKNFLTVNDQQISRDVHRDTPSPSSPDSLSESVSDVKLVEKWKKYWDEKLDTENEVEMTYYRARSPKSKESSVSPQPVCDGKEEVIETYNTSFESVTPPVKQELPEEVFKAFETSPKRFFGTSRKQILNKIDTFLGKPITADDTSEKVNDTTNCDVGLVSSRISLFRNLSQTEEHPWKQRKCQSMQNIFEKKDSNKSNISIEDKCANKPAIPTNTNQSKPVVFKDSNKRNSLENNPCTSAHEKRARMTKMNSFEEPTIDNQTCKQNIVAKPDTETQSVKKTISQYNKHGRILEKSCTDATLKKSSFSKSEMDIFKKFEPKPEDDFDKYKSCDELPKINVKNFISLYESVSKTDVTQADKNMSLRKLNRTSSGAVNKADSPQFPPLDEQTSSVSAFDLRQLKKSTINKKFGSEHFDLKNSTPSIDKESVETKETHVCLSDIELEIVEKDEVPLKSDDKSEPDVDETDYKTRFKKAKEFFQSMDEIGETKKPKKLNECQMLLLTTSTDSSESPKKEEPKRKKKKTNIKKSHSMPPSEISKYWKQLQEENGDSSKLVKISEKFNVDDLFNDVIVEGRLSRQGSLRGIPHKKAVLETFKSMESLTDNRMSPYEIAVSQLQAFAKENQIKNAQTYLSEYPYLPTTDPSKYHSRLDTKATGLISLKELKAVNKKPRRNSVPDLRWNTRFTVNL